MILFVAMTMPGLIVRTRAVLAGRRGPKFYKHISSVGVFFRKGTVVSPVTGFVFRLAPVIYTASAFTAMLCIPFGGFEPLFSFDGDVVLFCYLLALGRLWIIIAAMDTGSSFEGMGASREALYGALLEPAVFVVFGTLSLASGYTNFNEIFMSIGRGPEMVVAMALVTYCLFKILLVEGGRMPVDNPYTHLELTMVHEVMVLDYAGVDMGLITLAGWIKNAALAVLASSALASVVSYDVVVVVLFCGLTAIAIGITESIMARNRLARNTTYIMTILAVALLVFMVVFIVFMDMDIIPG